MTGVMGGGGVTPSQTTTDRRAEACSKLCEQCPSALWDSWTTCGDQVPHSRAVGTHSGHQGREAARLFAWILLGQVPTGWLGAALKELCGDNGGCWRPIRPRGSGGQVFKVPGVEPLRYAPREGPQGSSL